MVGIPSKKLIVTGNKKRLSECQKHRIRKNSLVIERQQQRYLRCILY